MFQKNKRMNKLHARFMQVINDGITQLMIQLADELEGSQHSKRLWEEETMCSPKANDTNSVVRQNSIGSHQTHEMDKLLHQLVRSDSESTDQV